MIINSTVGLQMGLQIQCKQKIASTYYIFRLLTLEQIYLMID